VIAQSPLVPLRRGGRPNPGAWCEATDPGAPRRVTTESTAGLLARGSPPVTAFPGLFPVAMWHGLAAYSCGGSCGFGTVVPHRIPCSLSDERPSIAPS